MPANVTTPCAACDCREDHPLCPELLAAMRRTYAALAPSMEADA